MIRDTYIKQGQELDFWEAIHQLHQKNPILKTEEIIHVIRDTTQFNHLKNIKPIKLSEGLEKHALWAFEVAKETLRRYNSDTKSPENRLSDEAYVEALMNALLELIGIKEYLSAVMKEFLIELGLGSSKNKSDPDNVTRENQNSIVNQITPLYQKEAKLALMQEQAGPKLIRRMRSLIDQELKGFNISHRKMDLLTAYLLVQLGKMDTRESYSKRIGADKGYREYLAKQVRNALR